MSRSIGTITLDAPGRLVFGESEAPGPPGPNEAIVRVHRVGICGTDIHAFRGRQPFFSYPRILGHELGVEIVEIGPNDRDLRPSDRCAVEPYLNCGACIACRHGKPNCCERLQVLGVHSDGGMRTLIRVPAAKLHRSEILTLDQLALVETLGIGAHAVQRSGLSRGENALIIGAGPIGLSVTQFALVAGARVLVMDVNPRRLDFCREHTGVDATILADDSALDQVKDLTDGDLPLVVLDATGSGESMAAAFRFAAYGGRLTLVGLFQGDVIFHDPDFHRRELTLLATRNSTPADFTRIIGLIEAGSIDTSPWITHHAACANFPEVFPSWLEPSAGLIKGIVEF
ncbi:MAG TPA: zinc-binding alcohol dehydrogenase family protein [Armatimonadota bacterium]|nr:zinc-binding alcohol dehydrogenase family protein [Armatimonadota bacterium]